MAQAKTKQVKVKKKLWVEILAPKSFNSMSLGETLIDESAKALGKSITTSLMVLTDDPRKQSYTIRFDVIDVKEGKAHTHVVGMNMTPSAQKRLIRRHRDKITDSFVVRIGGGRLIRVKPLLVTRTRTSKSAQTAIRLAVREKIKDIYRKMRFDDIVHDIIEMKIQKHLKDICSVTHPIRSVDIKEIVVLPENRKMNQEMEELLEKEAKEEDERREQLSKAAAAAAVDEESAPKPKKKPVKKAPVEDDDSDD